MHIRPDTWDGRIAASVITMNEYHLPDDMKGWIVVDVGAHIGAFASACSKRGAGTIHCYEPEPGNFNLLRLNTAEINSNSDIYIYNVAVVGIGSAPLGIRKLTDHDFGLGSNTGHVDVFGEHDGTESMEIASVLANADGNVDLLKIDCEGMEWAIFDYLDTSKVKRIVAELHAVPSGEHVLLRTYSGKSLASLCKDLGHKLMSAGFSVDITQTSAVTSQLTAYKASTVLVNDRMPRVLWWADSNMATGNARVSENICRGLIGKGWDVRVLGVGYNGDPHGLPYRVYPAVDGAAGGGDLYGSSRIANICKRVKPDIVAIQNDSWNVAAFMDTMSALNIWVPVVGYVAVDSENVRSDVAGQLSNLKHCICHTQYCVDQLLAAGYTGKCSFVGHGVDTRLYRNYDKIEARSGYEVRNADVSNAFIWGSVNMNQPRKRLDLVVAYFAAWWRAAGEPDNAYLYIHTNHKGSWDLRQLGEYLGIQGRLIGTESGDLSEYQMPNLYSSLDVMLSCAEGESWGLCQMESMACGVPQIAVKCGGMPSWAGDAVHWVEPSQYVFSPNRTNTKRWIASETDFVRAMNEMYNNADMRNAYSLRCVQTARKYTWDAAVDHIHSVLSQVLSVRRMAMAANTDAVADF